MRYLPLTLIFTLTASFLMALIFMPTLGSLIGKKADKTSNNVSNMAGDGDFDPNTLTGITGNYVRFVARIIQRPITFSGIIIAGIFAIFIIYGMSGTPVEFFPKGDPENIQINVHARGSLSLDERDALVQNVASKIQANEYVESFQSTTTALSDSSSDNTFNRICFMK